MKKKIDKKKLRSLKLNGIYAEWENGPPIASEKVWVTPDWMLEQVCCFAGDPRLRPQMVLIAKDSK